MSETTIVTKEEIPPPPTLPETILAQSIAFGQMTESNRQVTEKLNQNEVELRSMGSMLSEALQEMRALRSQTATISRQEEQLRESQTAIISEIMDNSEKEESKEAIPVTPMETKIEIEQKPANIQKSLFQRIFF